MARQSQRINKRRIKHTKKFSGKTNTPTACPKKWLQLKVDERISFLETEKILPRCHAQFSKNDTIEVIFDTMSGVTWISTLALEELPEAVGYRMFHTETEYSTTIPAIGTVRFNTVAKLSLFFQNKLSSLFKVEIDAIIVDTQIRGNSVQIGFNTMVQQGITISPSSEEISFETFGEVAMTKLPEFKKLPFAYEIIDSDRVMISTEVPDEDVIEAETQFHGEEPVEQETQPDGGEHLEQKTQLDEGGPAHPETQLVGDESDATSIATGE